MYVAPGTPRRRWPARLPSPQKRQRTSACHRLAGQEHGAQSGLRDRRRGGPACAREIDPRQVLPAGLPGAGAAASEPNGPAPVPATRHAANSTVPFTRCRRARPSPPQMLRRMVTGRWWAHHARGVRPCTPATTIGFLLIWTRPLVAGRPWLLDVQRGDVHGAGWIGAGALPIARSPCRETVLSRASSRHAPKRGPLGAGNQQRRAGVEVCAIHDRSISSILNGLLVVWRAVDGPSRPTSSAVRSTLRGGVAGTRRLSRTPVAVMARAAVHLSTLAASDVASWLLGVR
jgi:hypothetical protein